MEDLKLVAVTNHIDSIIEGTAPPVDWVIEDKFSELYLPSIVSALIQKSKSNQMHKGILKLEIRRLEKVPFWIRCIFKAD